MSKIGILAGTFNPIHNGHLALAQCAYDELGLDEVIFISSGISYFKSNIDMPSKEIRYNMTSLAVTNYSYFSSSDIEMKREGNTYTYETLQEMKKLYPNDELFFICGADTLNSISSWWYPEIIFSLCTVVAAVRDEIITGDLLKIKENLEQQYNAKIVIINFNKIEISSSYIRSLLVNENTRTEAYSMLPEKVVEYINKEKLYLS